MESSMIQAEVVKISGLNKSTKAIRFAICDKKQAKTFSFVPGQFIMIGVLGYGEAALTITTAPVELPEFEISVRSVGVATQAMHRLKAGDKAYFRGPYGNSLISDNIYGKELLLIAGGIGLSPLRSIIHTIRGDDKIVGSLKILYAAKTPEDLIFKGELKSWEKFAEVTVTVDNADHQWTGSVGRIDKVLQGLSVGKGAVVAVCGPPVMYAAVAKILLAKGLTDENILFMLERRMKCGVGKCQHCTCGGKYVCTDGPTFSWSEIKDNWEALR